MNESTKITFITPCFCRGADCSDKGRPEVRPASIRGQLHWWFRALGGTPQDENAIWGSVHGKASASKIVVRVKCSPELLPAEFPTLPHKRGGLAASKMAIPPDESFELLISTRLGGLSPDLEKKFNNALNAWLHLGALGLRATRGGGNFTWENQPATVEEYKNALKAFPIKTVFLDEVFTTAEAAREIITDTLGSEAFPETPLGSALPNRKTSPLRFRIVKFADGFRIIAIWDGRSEVTGNSENDLKAAVQELKSRKKRIGILLDQAGW